MAQAPPLTPPPRRAGRPGRGNGEEQGRVCTPCWSQPHGAIGPVSDPVGQPMPPRAEGISASQPSPGGLIFGLVRLRSSAFSRVRFNAAMQVTDVNGIRRTVIQTPENRKVGGSTPPLVATATRVNDHARSFHFPR